ncbi:class I SAM-dependent methyltransferase [Spirosoma taeanense]|uniref:Class I SAM-dependent methyltransferase n=1 Tax=Spirosoma taeanense TaxID=2735870 RepID=A0A6M5YDQ7_9BACT|nr:class I SAM-dependent methyltransferase [Spirosoma taeanense]QJW92109.1 class I SAM-dependent methyltransferase [Spirosoma taeanense]
MFKRLLPLPIRRLVKSILYRLWDQYDSLRGHRDPLTPPRSRIFIGAGDFRTVGQRFKQLFTELGGLKPTDAVLDVGCGIGRMAVPLTNYLIAPDGRYEGFDIVAQGITWCQRNITPRFPTFRFQLADVHNAHYNPNGRFPAHQYRFPYADNEFDFVFLTSVFTHMDRPEIERYTTQIARVLRPGGRAFITMFLLNDESRALMAAGQSQYNFRHALNGRWVFDPTNPEAGSAYDETFVRDLFARHQLTLREPIYYGSWCGRTDFTSFQDILILEK